MFLDIHQYTLIPNFIYFQDTNIIVRSVPNFTDYQTSTSFSFRVRFIRLSKHHHFVFKTSLASKHQLQRAPESPSPQPSETSTSSRFRVLSFEHHPRPQRCFSIRIPPSERRVPPGVPGGAPGGTLLAGASLAYGAGLHLSTIELRNESVSLSIYVSLANGGAATFFIDLNVFIAGEKEEGGGIAHTCLRRRCKGERNVYI